ncbi:hypothetical protein [Amycolatopsis tolypomycina]|uniref:hypothetical protein n=1 Tax=Amycolatopsis tolypomycina TaxID=208445 RepID=UPI0033B5A515
MKRPTALAVAGTAAARRKSPPPDRRLGVTVNLPPDEVGRDPQVRPAPGGRGTELAAGAQEGRLPARRPAPGWLIPVPRVYPRPVRVRARDQLVFRQQVGVR